MMVRVVEKPGFAKKYAFVAVNFGSIDTKFSPERRGLCDAGRRGTPSGAQDVRPAGGQRDGAVRAECWQQQRLYELCDDGLLRRVVRSILRKICPSCCGW